MLILKRKRKSTIDETKSIIRGAKKITIREIEKELLEYQLESDNNNNDYILFGNSLLMNNITKKHIANVYAYNGNITEQTSFDNIFLYLVTHHNEYSDTGASNTKISDTIVSHGKFNSFSLMPFPTVENKRISMSSTLSQRIEENVKQWKETMNDRHFTFKTKNYRVLLTSINRIDNKFISNPTL